MNILRTYRTVRHLSASQWAYRPVCRGKFVAMEWFPGPARRYFCRRAKQIGPFDFTSPQLAAAVAHVISLQRTVHGAFIAGIPQGRFTLLNREIDFGSLTQIEWRRDLGEHNNRLWRMNLSYMGYLVPLVESCGAKAVPIICSLLASMNQQNPWSSLGVFRDVWHPYSVSHRVINLLTCLVLLNKAGVALDIAVEAEIVEEIRFGAAFLLSNLERDLQYNHLFKNLVCLALVAAAYAGPKTFAASVLGEIAGSIQQQFLNDGGHAERAPMYHLLALIDLRILRDSKVLLPFDAEAVERTIELAESAVNVVVHPDGDVALFNDSWLGEAPPASELAASAIDIRPVAPLRIELPSLGYARLSRNGDNIIMDYGACGPDANPGHAHADFLSMELSVNGVRTVVDPGVPTYSAGELRDVSRSAASHNGPCVVGAEPIEFWSSFRIGRRGYAHRLVLPGVSMAVAGWHDGYQNFGLKVARAVQLLPGRGLLLVDLWRGSQRLPEQTGFVVGDEWEANGDGCFINRSTAQRLRLSVIEGRSGEISPRSYWDRFGMARTGTYVSFAPVVKGGERCLGLWFGWGDDSGVTATELLSALVGALERETSE